MSEQPVASSLLIVYEAAVYSVLKHVWLSAGKSRCITLRSPLPQKCDVLMVKTGQSSAPKQNNSGKKVVVGIQQ